MECGGDAFTLTFWGLNLVCKKSGIGIKVPEETNVNADFEKNESSLKI